MNIVSPTALADMVPSDELRAMLKQGEALRLTRYRLGDGGWTLGYGRYFPDGDTPPPASITRETAEQWFAEDVEQRGARWVRAYVDRPLQQWEFDALTSMAFNLRPSSFRTIAEAVNAGEDPEAASLNYVRAGTNLEQGLRNRRAREIALYRQAVYA
jgi:lysozyme